MIPITCDNLVIRLYKLKDTVLFYKYTSDKRLTKYLVCNASNRYQAVQTFVMGVVNRYSTEKITRFIIADKDTDKLVGAISVYLSEDGSSAELGYWIGFEYWGKGYMTKILRCIISKLSEIKDIKRIFIYVDEHNIGSIKAAEKAGLVHDGQPAIEKHGKRIILMERYL